MPISSLVIKTKKERLDEVVHHVSDFKEVTVSDTTDEDIVIITETMTQARDKSLWQDLQNVPGVIKCDLIYHNFEDTASLNT